MPFTQESIASSIHLFLIEEVIEDDEELAYNDNLLLDIGVESMGMLRLVGFIEEYYEINISPAYFTIENFKHINSISHFVERLIVEKQ